MNRSTASRPGWEMLSGYPSCTCATKPEQLPDELASGMPHACRHLYMKNSAERDPFHVSWSSAASLGSREGSPVGGEPEKPQGVRVQRGRPVSIVIFPMPPRDTDDMPCTPQSAPAFASLADERSADDMGVRLLGSASRANFSASLKRRTVRGSGRKSPFRGSCCGSGSGSGSGSGRSSSATGRSRQACNSGAVTLTLPGHSYEVDIKFRPVEDGGSANSPNNLAGKTGMTESAKANGQALQTTMKNVDLSKFHKPWLESVGLQVPVLQAHDLFTYILKDSKYEQRGEDAAGIGLQTQGSVSATASITACKRQGSCGVDEMYV